MRSCSECIFGDIGSERVTHISRGQPAGRCLFLSGGTSSQVDSNSEAAHSITAAFGTSKPLHVLPQTQTSRSRVGGGSRDAGRSRAEGVEDHVAASVGRAEEGQSAGGVQRNVGVVEREVMPRMRSVFS
jgi:hypothetical protein